MATRAGNTLISPAQPPAHKKKQKGLTTVEYAVAGALVAATLVMAFSELGDQVGVVITSLTSAIGG